MRAYGIYARVVDVSEIERVSASNEWNFWFKNECVNTIQNTFHVVLCLLHTYWDTHRFASLLFQIFQNPKISRGLRPGSKVNDWPYLSLGDLEKNVLFPKGKSWGFLVPYRLIVTWQVTWPKIENDGNWRIGGEFTSLDKQLAFLIKDKTTLLSTFGMNIREVWN